MVVSGNCIVKVFQFCVTKFYNELRCMGRRIYSKACGYDVVGNQVTKRYLSFFKFVISQFFKFTRISTS
jgi:hypothetical protein